MSRILIETPPAGNYKRIVSDVNGKQFSIVKTNIPTWVGNLPGGMTLVSERSWAALNEDGWYSIARSDSVLSIITDYSVLYPPFPYSSSAQVGRSSYQTTFVGGNEADGEGKTITGGPKDVYFCFAVKLSNNYENHPGSSVNKIAFGYDTNDNDIAYISAQGDNAARTSTLRLQVRLQRVSSVNYASNSGSANDDIIHRGVWNLIEVHYVGNTSGSSDGAIYAYLNGIKTHGYNNIKFSNLETDWSAVSFGPNWGGVSNSPLEEFYIYVDKTAIYKAN